MDVRAAIDCVQGRLRRRGSHSGQRRHDRQSDVVGEITAAASEQSAGINQVNQAITNLDQMTQQNAALVEESAAASENLKEQTRNLTHIVNTFRLSRDEPGYGGAASVNGAAASPRSALAARPPLLSNR